jgi:hypothetical protein
MAWVVRVHDAALEELKDVPQRDVLAITHALEKLAALGPALPYPHSSAVVRADRIRELRPRAGNCAWRAFYRQIGTTFVIAAIGPEADSKRQFDRAIANAEARLKELEEGENP